MLAAKNGLPRYYAQARLLLNLGDAREGERVVVNGLPWQVRSLNLVSELVNPALQQSDIEFGLGIGLQYTYPLMELISPYFLLVTGPHYISVDTTTQSGGFNFATAAGVGFYVSLAKKSRSIADTGIAMSLMPN